MFFTKEILKETEKAIGRPCTVGILPDSIGLAIRAEAMNLATGNKLCVQHVIPYEEFVGGNYKMRLDYFVAEAGRLFKQELQAED